MSENLICLKLNFDVTKVNEQMMFKQPDEKQLAKFKEEVDNWTKLPEATRPARPQQVKEFYPAREMTVKVIMDSIRAKTPQGNVQLLRKTKKLNDILMSAVKEEKNEVEITADDHRQIKSAINKNEKWNNFPEVADMVLAIADLIEDSK